MGTDELLAPMAEIELGSKLPAPSSPRRGVGRGGNFFVLDRDLWEGVWAAGTSNRLNFVTALLVLLAGTGADHRLTKWSAKACEERAGMGKPRARKAIEELIASGLAERTDAASPMFPQYRLAAPKSGDEPIFLPVQLVTGLVSETPILRRIRETGDPMLLRMLIDLYGLLQTDVTHGVPIENLRRYAEPPEDCRKIAEFGANTLWAVGLGGTLQGAGRWRNLHSVNRKAEEQPFWPRVGLLRSLGAIIFEPWVFSGGELDAEPLFPVFQESFGDNFVQTREALELSQVISEVTEELVDDRTYLLDQNADKFIFALPTHHQPPSIRGVARLRVEPDTPGRRLSYRKRMQAIESRSAAYRELLANVRAGRHDRPLRTM